MKKFAVFLAAVVIAGMGALAACDRGETSNEGLYTENILLVEGEVETTGEQTVTVKIAPAYAGVTFLSDIAKEDIGTANGILFKRVSAAAYVSPTEIAVTLTGTQTFSYEGEDGLLTVDGSAMSSGIDARGAVSVRKSSPKEVSLEELFKARQNGEAAKWDGAAVTVSGRVTAVEESGSGSVRFFLQDGDFGVYGSVAASAAGASLVRAGKDLTVSGILGLMNGQLMPDVPSSSAAYLVGVAASQTAHTANTLGADTLTSAQSLYLYGGSQTELSGLTVMSVDEEKKLLTVSLGEGTFTAHFVGELPAGAAAGSVLGLHGAFFVALSGGSPVLYLRESSSYTLTPQGA